MKVVFEHDPLKGRFVITDSGARAVAESLARDHDRKLLELLAKWEFLKYVDPGAKAEIVNVTPYRGAE